MSALDVVVNGATRARARLGLKREDVEAAVGGRNSRWSGFVAEVFVDDLDGQGVDVELIADFGREIITLCDFQVEVRGLDRLLPPRERSWRLEEILACPECGRRVRDEEWAFRCEGCRRKFEKRRGTPVFAPDEEVVQSRILDAGPTHPNQEVHEIIIERAAGGVVLNYGAGNPRQSDYHPNLLFHELVQYANTDVVSAYDRLPYRDDAFEAVISQAVFEHLARPWDAALEIHRVLKPGGVVHVDTAFMQPLHGDPYHYFNMTLAGVREIFRPFKHVRSGIKPHQLPSFGYRMQIESIMEHLRSDEWRARLEELKRAIVEDNLDDALDDMGRERVAAGFFFEGVKEG